VTDFHLDIGPFSSLTGAMQPTLRTVSQKSADTLVKGTIRQLLYSGCLIAQSRGSLLLTTQTIQKLKKTRI